MRGRRLCRGGRAGVGPGADLVGPGLEVLGELWSCV